MGQSAKNKCQHGYTVYNVASVDADERTLCCGAFASWWGDNSGMYCKCCYGQVD